jgi:hypothetical protein
MPLFSHMRKRLRKIQIDPIPESPQLALLKKGARVKPPLLKGRGNRGSQCPVYETPYDLVFD